MEYLCGNLFDAIKDKKGIIIPHVVNDKKKWGKGFVVPLGNSFPESKKAYLEWDEEKFSLGNVQFVRINEVVVANMLAQTLGGDRPLYYNHLVKCMESVAKTALEKGYEIYCPLFGSALAGGEWAFISELIKDCWVKKGIKVTVCYLESDKDVVEQLNKEAL